MFQFELHLVLKPDTTCYTLLPQDQLCSNQKSNPNKEQLYNQASPPATFNLFVHCWGPVQLPEDMMVEDKLRPVSASASLSSKVSKPHLLPLLRVSLSPNAARQATVHHRPGGEVSGEP